MFFDKEHFFKVINYCFNFNVQFISTCSKAEMVTSQPVCLHAVATFTMSLTILFDSSSDLKSFVPLCKITLSGFSSIVGLT